MDTALPFALLASSGLVAGAVVGAFLDVSARTVGAGLAFASGSLITALAFELVEPAFALGGPVVSASGLFLGTATFAGIDWLLDERFEGEESTGFALLASVTLDGIPENLALGVVLVDGTEQPPFALLAAIFASNFPQAFDGAASLVSEDRSRRYAIGLWVVTGAVLAATVVAGNRLFAGVGSGVLAGVRAFAGGAVLGSIVDEMLPDAYQEGGPVVALATVAGFVLTFVLL